MSCTPGLCHGSHCVWCAGCGTVAPCGLPSCRSCSEDLAEAQARRLRKVGWVQDGTLPRCMFASIPMPKEHAA